MKKTLSLEVTIYSLVMILFSCSKVDAPQEIMPMFTSLKANPSIAWYNNSVTVTGSATNATSFSVLGENFMGSSFNYETPKLTTPIILTVLATGPGGTTTKLLTIDVYSQDTSSLCHYGSLHQVSNIWYALADSLNPSQWHDNQIDPSNYTFLPDGSAQINGGPISPNAWTILQPVQNLEGLFKKRLALSGDTWDIDVVNPNILVRSQIAKNLFDTTKLFKTIQRFSH